jgi:chromosome segregation ATPase
MLHAYSPYDNSGFSKIKINPNSDQIAQINEEYKLTIQIAQFQYKQLLKTIAKLKEAPLEKEEYLSKLKDINSSNQLKRSQLEEIISKNDQTQRQIKELTEKKNQIKFTLLKKCKSPSADEELSIEKLHKLKRNVKEAKEHLKYIRKHCDMMQIINKSADKAIDDEKKDKIHIITDCKTLENKCVEEEQNYNNRLGIVKSISTDIERLKSEGDHYLSIYTQYTDIFAQTNEILKHNMSS